MSEIIPPRENKAKKIGITIGLGLYAIGACAFLNSPGEVQLAICSAAALITGALFIKPILNINKIYKENLSLYYEANPDERPEVKRTKKEKARKEEKIYRGHIRALRDTIIPTRPTILQAAHVYFNSRGAEKARASYVITKESEKNK